MSVLRSLFFCKDATEIGDLCWHCTIHINRVVNFVLCAGTFLNNCHVLFVTLEPKIVNFIVTFQDSQLDT